MVPLNLFSQLWSLLVNGSVYFNGSTWSYGLEFESAFRVYITSSSEKHHVTIFSLSSTPVALISISLLSDQFL